MSATAKRRAMRPTQSAEAATAARRLCGEPSGRRPRPALEGGMALCLLALLALAACGRVGDIRPPGPPEQATWPRTYPNR